MKRKYGKGGASYKLMKSTHANSGKSNKKANNKKGKVPAPLVGKKTLLINMSGNDKFCPVTGKKLPTHGMVVEHKGVYYADYEASARAEQASI
jgi:hypothetical protein